WSDGGSPIEVMAAAARILGRQYLGLTDHSPNLKIANGLSPERLMEQLTVVDGINDYARAHPGKGAGSRPGNGNGNGNGNGQASRFRLLAGIEVDILEDGQLDQSEELLSQLDVVVASVHSKL